LTHFRHNSIDEKYFNNTIEWIETEDVPALFNAQLNFKTTYSDGAIRINDA